MTHMPLCTSTALLAGRRPSRSLACLGLLAVLACTSAHAQFNGPQSLGTSDLNSPVTVTTDPAELYPAVQDILLEPGDLVAIHLFSDTEYSPVVRIGPDGTVLLPLIGVVHLEGLSVTKAEQFIAEKLSSAGMYRDPQVTLQITEGPSSLATVVGEIHNTVPIVGSRRLLDVLAVAGGIPATASHIVTINRPGLDHPIVVDLGTDPAKSAQADIPIFRGDTIVVSRVGIVYVLGSFKTSGIVPLNSYTPLTLTELTALSGGYMFEGKFNDCRIIRTVGSTRTVAVYDLKKVLNGKAPDPILQSNDIVYLPPVPFKQLLSSGALGTVLGIASLAISIEGR